VNLHSTDADGVPTPLFKRGVVRVQEMYSPGKASNSGDVTDSDRKKQTVKHG
jgi:hypothetical protein